MSSQGCPTFWRLWPHWKKKSCLGPHFKYTNSNEDWWAKKKVLGKCMILCWAAFIAILGHTQPTGRGLDTLAYSIIFAIKLKVNSVSKIKKLVLWLKYTQSIGFIWHLIILWTKYKILRHPFQPNRRKNVLNFFGISSLPIHSLVDKIPSLNPSVISLLLMDERRMKK